jgi:hypothetical protein
MKRITRDDLLHRISTGSPYEAVIVAAREARRLNRARITRQALFPPLSAGLGAAAELAGVGSDSLSDEDPLILMGDANSGAAHDVDFPAAGNEPPKVIAAEVKVTMQALERLAAGDVTYRITEGPIDPEED